MMLRLGTFPMNEVVFGAETCIQDKRLVLNREELVALALADQRITYVDLQIVRPGEKVRIVNIYDIVEPRMKVEGRGVVYPGVCGRPLNLVGEGLTHRLAGIAVIGCGETPRQDAAGRGFSAISQLRAFEFVEMSGSGAVSFPSHMINVCLVMEHSTGLTGETAHAAFQSAILRLSDRLAQLTVGREPPDLETFDITPIGGLPGVVLIAHLSSIELLRGPYTKVGMAVYGITRVAPPWVLSPLELLDGAICQGRSWIYVNNPAVLELLRRHGRDWNFLACLAYPTNWGMQEEKQIVSNRAAMAAKMLGAQGAIVTTDVRGQRTIETMLTIQACERMGIKTILLTEEEDPEDGIAPPFIAYVPEAVAIVSTGTGGCAGPFPAVEKVVGARNPEERWYKELPGVHGRYGASHLRDFYGYGKQSYADY